MLRPPLEMDHRFIRSYESLEGSGGLPTDPPQASLFGSHEGGGTRKV